MKQNIKSWCERLGRLFVGRPLDLIEEQVSAMHPPLRQQRMDVIDALALATLSPYLGGYLPWTAASLRPSAVQMVVNDIFLNQHRVIVECGAGVSTLVIARVVKTLGGKLYSIEHDAEWCKRMQDRLQAEELQDQVTIVHAPLVPCETLCKDAKWYDIGRIRAAIPQSDVGLLLIDGPPAASPEVAESRMPALPMLWEVLAADATVILDDIHRAGEQQIVQEWERQFNLSFSLSTLRGGVAYAHRGAQFAI